MRVEEDGKSRTVVLGSLPHGPGGNNPAGRLAIRIVSAMMLGVALICAVVMAVTSALGVSDGGFLIVSAYAQSQQQNPLEKARTAVENLIDRLRGRDMPDGIVKTNGRIEATQVDVAAKYPGRLATLTVDEGDEVTAGQVVAHHLVAGNRSPAAGRASAGAQSKTGIGRSDCAHCPATRAISILPERIMTVGKPLLEHGTITQQILDQRRNKFESAEAAYVAANAQRDAG